MQTLFKPLWALLICNQFAVQLIDAWNIADDKLA